MIGLDTLVYCALVLVVSGALFRSGGALTLALDVRDLLRRPSGRHRAAPPMPGVDPTAAASDARDHLADGLTRGGAL